VDDFVAWGVVLGRGQAQGGAVLERHDALHRALAKGLFAHNKSPAPILEAARNNLGSAGAATVDQDDHLQIGVLISAAGRVLGIGLRASALSRDDQFTALDEQFAHFDRLIEKAARV